jgi:glucose/mannose-6-phosphate isomerase
MYQRLDKENMFSAIWDFPENLSDALELGNSIKLNQKYDNIQGVVIAGMGGSAIGGDVIPVLEKNNITVPISVCRGYSVPNWVNENILVICSSYSGNTEETLAALDDALEKNAIVCGVTTGGGLADRLRSIRKDVIIIPGGLQPRAALAFSFVPMIKLLEQIGLLNTQIDTWIPMAIESLSNNRKLHSLDSTENPIFELSNQLCHKIPIIYSDSSTMGVAALRLKGQICENSKMLCYYNELPELNHNEIVGWENNSNLFDHLFILWLCDNSDNQRVKFRQEITQTILNEKKVDQFVIEMTESTFQERFLNMINYGDWLSYWCAIAHNTDPSPVKNIARLKKELNEIL